MPIGEHLSIVSASIVDPYILLQLHDGSALLLQGDMSTKDVSILSQSSILNVSVELIIGQSVGIDFLSASKHMSHPQPRLLPFY